MKERVRFNGADPTNFIEKILFSMHRISLYPYFKDGFPPLKKETQKYINTHDLDEIVKDGCIYLNNGETIEIKEALERLKEKDFKLWNTLKERTMS